MNNKNPKVIMTLIIAGFIFFVVACIIVIGTIHGVTKNSNKNLASEKESSIQANSASRKASISISESNSIATSQSNSVSLSDQINSAVVASAKNDVLSSISSYDKDHHIKYRYQKPMNETEISKVKSVIENTNSQSSSSQSSNNSSSNNSSSSSSSK